MAIMITYVCDECGCVVKALVKKGNVRFSIRDKIIDWDELISVFGNYVCLDCGSESNLTFEVFK